MNELDFTLELNSDNLTKETEYALFTEADTRLKALSGGHTDLTGAAITIRQPAHGETPILYEVTVVVYSRPNHIAATQKEADVYQAFNGALNAAERQIRERREKLKKTWEQPGNHPIEQEIAEVMIAEADKDLIDES